MYSLSRHIHRVLIAAVALLLATLGHAQQTTLYDPQPPANAAYVRVIVGGDAPEFDVWVDKKRRLSKLVATVPSVYMVLPAGGHDLSVQAGKQQVSVKIDAQASRSLTVLIPSFGTHSKPIVTEDKINGNRLKSIISVYQLGAADSLDVWTADGGTQVFKSLPMGGTAALVVNPIALDFHVTAAGSKLPLATGKLDMTPGGAYSLVITEGKTGGLKVQSHVNTVERYQTP